MPTSPHPPQATARRASAIRTTSRRRAAEDHVGRRPGRCDGLTDRLVHTAQRMRAGTDATTLATGVGVLGLASALPPVLMGLSASAITVGLGAALGATTAAVSAWVRGRAPVHAVVVKDKQARVEPATAPPAAVAQNTETRSTRRSPQKQAATQKTTPKAPQATLRARDPQAEWKRLAKELPAMNAPIFREMAKTVALEQRHWRIRAAAAKVETRAARLRKLDLSKRQQAVVQRMARGSARMPQHMLAHIDREARRAEAAYRKYDKARLQLSHVNPVSEGYFEDFAANGTYDTEHARRALDATEALARIERFADTARTQADRVESTFEAMDSLLDAYARFMERPAHELMDEQQPGTSGLTEWLKQRYPHGWVNVQGTQYAAITTAGRHALEALSEDAPSLFESALQNGQIPDRGTGQSGIKLRKRELKVRRTRLTAHALPTDLRLTGDTLTVEATGGDKLKVLEFARILRAH